MARRIVSVAALLPLLRLSGADCPSTPQCDCSWAPWGCNNPYDGSACWRTCCACDGSAQNITDFTTPKPVVDTEWTPGKTTRYWDCCKPSCAWPNKFKAKEKIKVCAADGRTQLQGAEPMKNACGGGGDEGGPAYLCSDQRPMYDPETNTSMLFAAAALLGLTEADWCCACYELVLDQPAQTGRLVVQVTNTGYDLGANHFDLQIPGGGFGIFDSCSSSTPNGPPMYPGTPSEQWGQRYGGLLAAGATNASACDALPEDVRSGCSWFFNHFASLHNPTMQFRRVACPAKMLEVSGCVREDEEARFGPAAPTTSATPSEPDTPTTAVPSAPDARTTAAPTTPAPTAPAISNTTRRRFAWSPPRTSSRPRWTVRTRRTTTTTTTTVAPTEAPASAPDAASEPAMLPQAQAFFP